MLKKVILVKILNLAFQPEKFSNFSRIIKISGYSRENVKSSDYSQ